MDLRRAGFFCTIVVTIFCLFLVSCSRAKLNNNGIPNNQANGGNSLSDTIYREKLKERKRQEIKREFDLMGDVLIVESRKAGLSTLRTSKLSDDSDIEIRIWAGFDLEPIRVLIVEKRKDRLQGRYLEATDKELGKKRKKVLFKSQEQLERIWKVFKKFGIETIPDEADVVELEPDEDSGVVIVEVLNQRGYRYFLYTPPCSPTNAEARRLANILKTIRQEFDIKLTNCQAINIDS